MSRTGRRKGKKDNPNKQTSADAGTFEEIPTVTVEECEDLLAETGVESDVDTATEQARTELRKIWSTPPNDELLLQIGPFVITRRSLHFLKTALSDDIIDAALALMIKGRNILHINSVVATAFFQGNGNLHGYLENENFNMYDACIGAVNEGGCHWVLIIIHPQEKSIIYINPMGELPRSEKTLLKHWIDFLKDRYEAGIDTTLPQKWTSRTINHSKQLDSSSCGVYVIKKQVSAVPSVKKLMKNQCSNKRDGSNIRVLRKKKVGKRKFNLRNIYSYERRSYVYPKLKSSTKTYCVCRKQDDGRKYMQCENCDEWFHPECVGVTNEPEAFFCSSCSHVEEPKEQQDQQDKQEERNEDKKIKKVLVEQVQRHVSDTDIAYMMLKIMARFSISIYFLNNCHLYSTNLNQREIFA